MASSYPSSLDSFTNPSASDALNSATVPHATQHANVNNAIVAIETTLGTNPQGSASSVKSRFDGLDVAVSRFANQYMQCSQLSSGAWFGSYLAGATNQPTKDRLSFTPFYVDAATTFTTAGFNVTLGQASTSSRIGIYTMGSGYIPATVLFDSGAIDTSTSGAKTATCNITLSVGLYYLSYCSNGGTTQPTFSTTGTTLTTSFAPAAWTNATQPTTLTNGAWYSTATGALQNNPSLTATGSWGTVAVHLKKA